MAAAALVRNCGGGESPVPVGSAPPQLEAAHCLRNPPSKSMQLTWQAKSYEVTIVLLYVTAEVVDVGAGARAAAELEICIAKVERPWKEQGCVHSYWTL